MLGGIDGKEYGALHAAASAAGYAMDSGESQLTLHSHFNRSLEFSLSVTLKNLKKTPVYIFHLYGTCHQCLVDKLASKIFVALVPLGLKYKVLAAYGLEL